MKIERENPVLWTQLPPSPAFLPALKLVAPLALLALGAGVIFALPQAPDEPQQVAAASLPKPQPGASVDDSFCDKQAWPYVDQRCAQKIEAARGSRQVRIVTDKGNSVQTVTAMPVVEPKPAPKPQPVLAKAEPVIGPAVAPNASSEPAQQQAVAPAKPEPVTTASTPEPAGSKAMASANVPPAASREPVAPGIDALDETRPRAKLSRSERADQRALEKAQKREAKRDAQRLRRIEQETGSVPQQVVDAARDEERYAERPRKKQRVRNGGVPDEVIAAVEEATRRDRGRTVTLETPRGRRVIVVPGDGGW